MKTTERLARCIAALGACLSLLVWAPEALAFDGSGPGGGPGGGTTPPLECQDTTQWPANNTVAQVHSFDNADGSVGATASISMLFIREEFTETCGDDGVHDVHATCTVRWHVRLGASAVHGDLAGFVAVALYRNGAMVIPATKVLPHLAAEAEATAVFTVTQGCGNTQPELFEVRPDPAFLGRTSLAVNGGGQWVYPLKHDLNVGCAICDGAGDGGDVEEQTAPNP